MDYIVVKAFTLRNLSLTFKTIDRSLNLFYWPLLNIIVWGMTSVWVQQASNLNNFLATFLTVLIFWQITLRSGIDIAKNLLDEIITKNLINIFITPIDEDEWILSVILSSVISSTILIAFSGLMAWLIYSINIFHIGVWFLPFILVLMVSGWALGLFLCGLTIWLGRRGTDLIFTLGWLIAPFSAVYAPLNILPKIVQKVAIYLPMTYVFENIRFLLKSQSIVYSYLIFSILGSIFYFFISLLFFKFMFKRAKMKGLASLE